MLICLHVCMCVCMSCMYLRVSVSCVCVRARARMSVYAYVCVQTERDTQALDAPPTMALAALLAATRVHWGDKKTSPDHEHWRAPVSFFLGVCVTARHALSLSHTNTRTYRRMYTHSVTLRHQHA